MNFKEVAKTNVGVLYLALGLLLFVLLLVVAIRAKDGSFINSKYNEYNRVKLSGTFSFNYSNSSMSYDDERMAKLSIRSQGLDSVVIDTIEIGNEAEATDLFTDINRNETYDEGIDVRHDYSLSKKNKLRTGILIENISQPSDNEIIPYWFPVTELDIIIVYTGKENIGDISISATNENAGGGVDIQFAAADYGNRSQHHEKMISTNEFIENNPEFKQVVFGSNTVELTKGVYDFSDTTIIPRGTRLVIRAGVVIRMAEAANIVSYGQVVIEGSDVEAVTVITQNEDAPFGVFAIVGPNATGSKISGLKISGGSESWVNGTYLSGMFSAYHLDEVEISNSTFADSASDDGLNVKYSNARIIDNSFFGNSADALDLDIVTGLVSGNFFSDNGNDAIDISQSNDLEIHNNQVLNSGDKCISVGESSNPLIVNNVLKKCHIGVEVKDESAPVVAHNLISDNRVGVNSYQKKDFFGGGQGVFISNAFVDNDTNITFNNSFIGELLHTDNSYITLINNILTDDAAGSVRKISAEGKCVNCAENQELKTVLINGSNETANKFPADPLLPRSFYGAYRNNYLRVGYSSNE